MRNFFIVFTLIYVSTMLTGCVSMKQTEYSVNQLKTQMMNVENTLARHNLMIQQNKTEIDNLYDVNEKSNNYTAKVTKVDEFTYKNVKPQAIMPKIVKVSSLYPSILSDKLNDNVSIYDVQESLKNAGFYIGKVDGKPGPLTKEAIKRFQRANKLDSDGVIGNKTWAVLKGYL